MEAMKRLLDELGLEREPEKKAKISELIGEEFQEIESHLERGEDDDALASLFVLSSALNFASFKGLSPLPDVEKWIKRLKDTTKKVAQRMGADGFTISANVPWGVSVSVSFPIN